MKPFTTTFCLTVLFSTSAFAHHPLAGMPMTTFTDGLFSGIGHPILGIDHLFFVIAAGIAASFTKTPKMLVGCYLIGVIVGVEMLASGVAVPWVEYVVVLSLIGIGGFVLSGNRLNARLAWPLLLIVGLFHGFAFGESIAGAELGSETVLWGYLIGLCVIQGIIGIAAGFYVTGYCKTQGARDIRPRLLGAISAGVGIALLIENIESALLTIA